MLNKNENKNYEMENKTSTSYVDLNEYVVATYYDVECEEWLQKVVTIEEILNEICDEYTIHNISNENNYSDKEIYDIRNSE